MERQNSMPSDAAESFHIANKTIDEGFKIWRGKASGRKLRGCCAWMVSLYKAVFGDSTMRGKSMIVRVQRSSSPAQAVIAA